MSLSPTKDVSVLLFFKFHETSRTISHFYKVISNPEVDIITSS